MSFYGKSYKKTKLENIDEALDVLKVPERVRALIKTTDDVTRFEKNADGTIKYIVSKNGVEVLNHNVKPDVETETTSPEGIKVKAKYTFTDKSVELLLTLSDGSKLHMDRVYEGNTMKTIIWRDGVDIKGISHYEQI